MLEDWCCIGGSEKLGFGNRSSLGATGVVNIVWTRLKQELSAFFF